MDMASALEGHLSTAQIRRRRIPSREYAEHSAAIELKAEQGAFVEAVTGERLHAVLSYVNLQGQTWQDALWLATDVNRVVNHSTYHRGQLTTMLRQLGTVPVPDGLSGVPR